MLVRPRVGIVALLVIVVGCGVEQPDGITPNAADHPPRNVTAGPPVGEYSPIEAEIPPRLGPDDPRSPIQRFVGVPADPHAAADWESEIIDTATARCMGDSGFLYYPELADSPPGSDPNVNETYFLALTDVERTAYTRARWGGDPLAVDENSCETIARNHAFPLNGLQAEYSAAVAAFYESDAIRPLVEARNECIEALGASPDVPGPALQRCSDEVGLSEVVRESTESFEIDFITEHLEYFEGFVHELELLRAGD